jgi:hypothetical protein
MMNNGTEQVTIDLENSKLRLKNALSTLEEVVAKKLSRYKQEVTRLSQVDTRNQQLEENLAAFMKENRELNELNRSLQEKVNRLEKQLVVEEEPEPILKASPKVRSGNSKLINEEVSQNIDLSINELKDLVAKKNS